MKNAIHRLLADGRHEIVQSLVLLKPRPEHFNLDAKSEGLRRPKAMSYPDRGIQAIEAEHHLHTTNPTHKAHSRAGAVEAPTTRLWNAHTRRKD